MDTYTRVSLNLFPYRNLPVTSRIKIFHFETDSAIRFFETATDQLRYYQDYSESETPSKILALAEKLSGVGKDLNNLLNNIETQDDNKNTLDRVNAQTGDLLEHITIIVDEFKQEEPDLQRNDLEPSNWFSNIKHNTELIQAAVHTLIDQHNSLPDDLTEWAINRHEIKRRAKTGDQTILPQLLKTLKNPEPFIRREAVILFKYFDASIDLTPLTILLDDSSDEVRQATAQTLGNLGSQEAIVPLVNALDTIGVPAAAALFKLGDPRGRTYLLEQLEEEDVPQKQTILRLFLDDLKQLWSEQHILNAINDSDIAHNQELAQKIIDRLKTFEPYFAPYSYALCNELRHYSGAISERKSMEYANIILENNVMDRYIIHILSDWYLDRHSKWFDQEKGIQALLSKARTYSDLVFLEVSCLLEVANLFSSQEKSNRARELFLEILNRTNSDNSKSLNNYQRFAWMRLKIIDSEPN